MHAPPAINARWPFEGPVTVLPPDHSAARVHLEPIGREAWNYCCELACLNMGEYLRRRGQTCNTEGWMTKAASREFFAIQFDGRRVGFASVWHDRDNDALHLGDLQIEASHRGQGIGSTTLRYIIEMASARRLKAVTLHVFRENPALHLYRRQGFHVVDRCFDKLTLRRDVPPPAGSRNPS